MYVSYNFKVIDSQFIRFPPIRGYEAAEEKLVNMFETGIIDPPKVVHTGLSDARYNVYSW
jgi:hypothetical protein